MESAARTMPVFLIGGIAVCGVRLPDACQTRDFKHSMRSDEISSGISHRSRHGISDEIKWDLMGSDEITQGLAPAPNSLHMPVVALTPGEAGVNRRGNLGVNAVENSGLTPPIKCAPNAVLFLCKSLITPEMLKISRTSWPLE